MSGVVEIVKLSTAEELLSALHPLSDRYLPDPRGWAFRGHGDSSWKLEPSANRPESWKAYSLRPRHASREVGSVEWYDALVKDLGELLHEFCLGLDECGLPIPGDSEAVQQAIRRMRDFGKESFDAGLDTLFALARHHGLPSPLLDWSWDGRIAAYFAAAEAATAAKRTSGHLHVWAFDTTFAKEWSLPGRGAITILTVSRATNPNMHAQAGLFTTCGGVAGSNDLREYVESLAQTAVDEGYAISGGRLVKFELPRPQAPRLLRLLGYERIDAARLFPGADGVVRRLRERLIWDRQP